MRTHTQAHLRQEGWTVKQETAITNNERRVDHYESVCTYEFVSTNVFGKRIRCQITSVVSAAHTCMNYTATKPQRMYLEKHIHTPSQNFLSFEFYLQPQHDFRFQLVKNDCF